MKMMEQSSSNLQHSSLFASATEDELFVSQILLQLGNLLMGSEFPTKFAWGGKKRRSSLSEASSYSPEKPSSLPSEEDCAAAAKTSSPTSPLSFFPSEIEEKSKHSSKKSSKKRSREKYKNTIEELMECGDLLRGELGKVRNYYNELRTYNSGLKALKRQVLKTCPKKDSRMETNGFMNLVMNPTQHYRIKMLTHQQPFIADPRVQKYQDSAGPGTAPHHIGSFYNGLEPVNQVVGLARIPDLNLSAEEAFGVDTFEPLDLDRAIADRRARFAEARRMRRGIIKITSMRSARGTKLPGINTCLFS